MGATITMAPLPALTSLAISRRPETSLLGGCGWKAKAWAWRCGGPPWTGEEEEVEAEVDGGEEDEEGYGCCCCCCCSEQ